MQPFRAPEGGIIDRSMRLRFRFDGVNHEGYAGDTLASALLANGVHLVGRSFKYHRPRGILSAGPEEPNALMQIASGARTEPNIRATQQELYDGLEAASQNRWPSLRFDVGAINDLVSRLLPAGFYYKTFMWPPTPRWWLRYEHAIRHAAGLGRAADAADPDGYAHRFAHCDVLVIGGGPSGIAAARAASSLGARVILCDENAAVGGRLRGDETPIDGMPAQQWLNAAERSLAAEPRVTLLTRTCAFGYFDQNLVGLVEHPAHAHSLLSPGTPRQRLWHVRARVVVLAAGAHERGIAYAGNDIPGTMLAGAARIYATRYAVRAGSRAVLFTNNDSAYAAALALQERGCSIAAIVDARATTPDTPLPGRAIASGIQVLPGASVVKAHGRQRVAAVEVRPNGGGATQRIVCDLVCMSGGWNPAVHLYSQARGTLRYDNDAAAFLPAASPQAILAAGAANGRFDLSAALAEGHAAGISAAERCGMSGRSRLPVPRADATKVGSLIALWSVEADVRTDKRFVDFQSDVTVSDVALAAREGYRSVEHLKRYTTLGMGTDQGKTSNIIGLALLAEQLGRTIPEVGTTTFRPPYTPVTLGAIAGREAGAHVEPTRFSAMHEWHVEHGARFVNTGLWKRPHSYRRPGESEDAAVNREALNVRSAVGVVDVSTLGKIELQGRDVAELLNRVYINRWDSLAVGRCRYGVMLRDDGMVMDDGTTSRLAATHYLMTTTTVNAVKVMQHLEYLLQVVWPELEVHATSVTEQWSAAALSGPLSRSVLAKLVDIDVSNEAFPFVAVRECRFNAEGVSIPARVFRMSYSGELAYEIHVPADHGLAMWRAVMRAGAEFGIMPYGTEAMSTLRIEKGHIVIGPEADGRTTADDLGLGKMVSPAKWCIGKPLLERPALTAPGRWQLVGLTAIDGNIPRGAKIVADPDRAAPNPMQGHVTSWCWSPHVDASIALALVANGRARHGEEVWAVSPLAGARVKVRIGPSCFIDPEGERLRV